MNTYLIDLAEKLYATSLRFQVELKPDEAADFARIAAAYQGVVVRASGTPIHNLQLPPGMTTEAQRKLLDRLREKNEEHLAARQDNSELAARIASYELAFKMQQHAPEAVDFAQETAETKALYGVGEEKTDDFGRKCLLARRLVERGVAFVEVTLGGWDTHNNNFDQLRPLCGTLDRAWAALMRDLEQRGLLDRTTIVWAGEFGRTPKINPQRGRDHFAPAWSTVLAGGGVKGGQAVGRTSADGTTVEDRPVSAADFLATVCRVAGIDPEKQNMSNVGRPIRIVDKPGKPIREIVG